jgi:hypothetical protein
VRITALLIERTPEMAANKTALGVHKVQHNLSHHPAIARNAGTRKGSAAQRVRK